MYILTVSAQEILLDVIWIQILLRIKINNKTINSIMICLIVATQSGFVHFVHKELLLIQRSKLKYMCEFVNYLEL